MGAACDEIVTTLVDNVRDVVRQLGTRIRLLPSVTGEYGYLREAEVKKILKHDDSPDKVSFGSTPAAITKEMKSGSYVRNTARVQLAGLADALEDQLVKQEKKQKVHRRRIG